jgi:phage baseplate assembly protein W
MFEMTSTTMETIKQNLVLFFATDEKERVVNCQLGSKFRSMLFEPDLNTIKIKVENETNRIFNTFFPNLKLLKMSVEFIDDSQLTQGALNISITYAIKNLEKFEQGFSVTIG